MSDAVLVSLVGTLGTLFGGSIVAFFTYVLPRYLDGKKDISLAAISDGAQFRRELLDELTRLRKEDEAQETQISDQHHRLVAVEEEARLVRQERDEVKKMAAELQATLEGATRTIADARAEIIRLETLLRSHGIDPKSPPRTNGPSAPPAPPPPGA